MQSKKYYQSIKRRIEEDTTRRDFGQPAVKEHAPKKARIDLSGFYIPIFPKRLKRGFWSGLDFRYYAILLSSLVFHLALIYVFYQNTSFELSQKKIEDIHSNYAKLILEQESLITSQIPEAQKTMARPDESRATETSPGTGDPAGPRRDRKRAATSDETKIPDSGQLEEERQYALEARKNRSHSVSTQVGSMGLLEYIKGTVITSKVDDAFLNYTDAANRNFIRMMDGLDVEDLALLKLNRATAGAFGFPGDSGELDTLNFKNKIKPTERSARKATPKELFGSDEALEEIEALPVGKNEKFEEKPVELDPLMKLQKRVVKRIPSELSVTIQRHTQAIQDCYKTVLRKEVSLNGKVAVRISIDAAGRVVDAEIVSSTVNNSQMEHCLVSRIRRWRDFGNCPTQQGIFTFTQTFSFGM
jgi:TonB family protein